MAPGFFSKLVKPQSGSRPERDDSLSLSQSRPRSPSLVSKGTDGESARARALSTPDPHRSYPSFNVTPPLPDASNVSLSPEPSVTVIPPSPRSHTSSIQTDSDVSVAPRKTEQEHSPRKRPPSLTNLDQSMVSETNADMPTPTPSSSKTLGVKSSTRSLTPSSSTGNLRDRVRNVVSSRSSSRPRTNQTEPPIPPLQTMPHRAATVSTETHPTADFQTQPNGTDIMFSGDSITGVTELQASPTSSLSTPQGRAFTIASSNPALPPESQFLAPVRDPDSISISSTASGRKRRLWRRGSTSTPQASPKRKTTGLASAIVSSMSGSGGTSNSGTAAPSPPVSPPRRSNSKVKRSPALSGHHAAASQSSIDSNFLQLSPQTMRPRQDYFSTRPLEHESGSVSSTDGQDAEGEGDDSEDDELLAELNDGDIPVTGFAVASNKRNADFHELFRTIPEGDYLIEDYGCALQREILVQGRIYISENHICFHANIFGWVTDLIVPIYEIVSLEKKMTAFVIPNAIQVTTRTTKYTFASFLARDTAYDVIYNIWRLARPEDGLFEDDSIPKGRPGLDTTRPLGSPSTSGSPATPVGTIVLPEHKVTYCACGKEGKHFTELILDTVLPGTPERIYNLIFASAFLKDFMRVNQKLEDIQIADWAPCPDKPGCLFRNMSYIRPLGGGIGPKSAKCEIHDEMEHCDFDDYVAMVTTTRTPDVPSGGAFCVMSRTCITWASSASSRVLVTSQVEWTGRSFIKGFIEKSAIEGQRSYQRELERAMRDYAQEHQAEFIPAGLDPAAVAVAVQGPSVPSVPTSPVPQSEEEARKEREKERNQRGLQWAYDTLEGAISVGQQSTTVAIELIRDAWDQSSTSTILYFVITFLVISNLWTLMLVGRREEAGRRKEMRRNEEREKTVHGIVTALWEELAAGRQPGGAPPPPLAVGSQIHHQSVRLPESWRDEVGELGKSLDAVEERVRLIRKSLAELD